MVKQQNPDDRFRSRVQQSTIRLFYWTATWLLSTAILAFGPRFLWNEFQPATLLALAANVFAGIGMIVANKRHLKELDELLQKILLEAMGITLGVGLIVAIPYSLMEAYDAVDFEAEISILVLLMGLTFITSVLLGLRRYR